MYKSVKKIKTTSFGHRFSVSEYNVQLLNGVRANFFIRESTPFSIIVPILNKDMFVMVKQHRFAANKNSLEFPMGHVADKDPKKVAAQELKEETGYLAKKLTPLFSFNLSPAWSNQIGHIFVAEGLIKGVAEPELTEEIVIVKIKVKDINKLIRNKTIFDATTILTFLYFEKYWRDK